MECKVTVDRITGKFDIDKGQYRCYAASAERFPGVRNSRWQNFESVKNNIKPIIPNKCKAIRIHSSGDFFNQKYFDMWIEIAKENPNIELWAYTKSLNYWVNRINEIPNNLILTASYGGKLDYLINEFDLKNVKVYKSHNEVQDNRPVDFNDDYARIPKINFALLDNMLVSKNNKTV